MLLPFLLAALLLPVQQASTDCVNTGANIATTQTQPVRGPDGVAAVLKVSSADDHSKNSHECNALYQLVVIPAASAAPVVVNLLTSDADYGRSLSVRLDGFSQDGQRVFGILSESGKYPSATLFDYDTTGGGVQLIDLKKKFARIIATGCSTIFDVVGTTETGEIVLELDSANQCAPNSRWLLNPTSSRLQHLPQGASVLGLYK